MPQDCFQILGLKRQAALNEETVKSAYLEKTRVSRSDQPAGGDEQAAELNKALEVLSTAEKRLKHLIELEAPEAAATWKTVPLDAELMRLFGKIGPFVQSLAAFARKKQTAASALAKALLAGEEMQLRERAEELTAELAAMRERIESGLGELDSRREQDDAAVIRDLQILQAKLAYLGKWQAQVREGFMSLV